MTRLLAMFTPMLSLGLAMLVYGLGASSPARADEIDALVAKTQPPTRFAAHVPNFAAREQQFTFPEYDGTTKTQTFWVIMDGDRYVALYDRAACQLDVITFDPSKAPTAATLNMPHRYSWVTLLGTRTTTCVWYDTFAPTGDTQAMAFTGGGKTLTLKVSEAWKPDGKYKRTAQSEYAFTLRCDPVLGYVFDITTTFATDDAKDSKGNSRYLEFFNVQPGRLSDPWPSKWRYDRTILTPEGSNKFIGWFNNQAAGELSDSPKIPIRNGGFIGFFARDGWGVAMSHVDRGGVKAQQATCNVWQDQHHLIALPDKPGADGMYRIDAKYRFLGTPPEVTQEIEQRAETKDFGGQRMVMIRLGTMENFEDQPLPLTTPTRGLWTWGLQVTDAQAHSGKKSLVVNGVPAEKLNADTGRFIAPVVSLDPDSTYHLESWIYVEGEGTGAFISALGNPSLDPAKIGTAQTAHVRTGEGWRKVMLDITTGPAGGGLNPRFLVIGNGKAYFDDFCVQKIGE